MTIPSYFTSEMHQQKFPDQTEFQSWIVNFQVEVCTKAKNLALVFAVDQEIEATQLAEGPHHSRVNNEKDFSDCEALDLMMAAAMTSATILLV